MEDMAQDITILKILLVIILGLFVVLLTGTHARINDLQNQINYSINNIQGE